MRPLHLSSLPCSWVVHVSTPRGHYENAASGPDSDREAVQAASKKVWKFDTKRCNLSLIFLPSSLILASVLALLPEILLFCGLLPITVQPLLLLIQDYCDLLIVEEVLGQVIREDLDHLDLTKDMALEEFGGRVSRKSGDVNAPQIAIFILVVFDMLKLARPMGQHENHAFSYDVADVADVAADVGRNVFLHDDLEEEVYREQPPGFVAQGEFSLMCRLRRSLCGMKQSPRA
ncbi:hypothetical protein FXO38_01850 [Capsicum annuum]|nr:hypothetical protein FXO38_01850 [Capsicum annuum]